MFNPYHPEAQRAIAPVRPSAVMAKAISPSRVYTLGGCCWVPFWDPVRGLILHKAGRRRINPSPGQLDLFGSMGTPAPAPAPPAPVKGRRARRGGEFVAGREYKGGQWIPKAAFEAAAAGTGYNPEPKAPRQPAQKLTVIEDSTPVEPEPAIAPTPEPAIAHPEPEPAIARGTVRDKFEARVRQFRAPATSGSISERAYQGFRVTIFDALSDADLGMPDKALEKLDTAYEHAFKIDNTRDREYAQRLIEDAGEIVMEMQDSTPVEPEPAIAPEPGLTPREPEPEPEEISSGVGLTTGEPSEIPEWEARLADLERLGAGTYTPPSQVEAPVEPEPSKGVLSPAESAKRRSEDQRHHGKMAALGREILSHFPHGHLFYNGRYPSGPWEGKIIELPIEGETYPAVLWNASANTLSRDSNTIPAATLEKDGAFLTITVSNRKNYSGGSQPEYRKLNIRMAKPHEKDQFLERIQEITPANASEPGLTPREPEPEPSAIAALSEQYPMMDFSQDEDGSIEVHDKRRFDSSWHTKDGIRFQSPKSTRSYLMTIEPGDMEGAILELDRHSKSPDIYVVEQRIKGIESEIRDKKRQRQIVKIAVPADLVEALNLLESGQFSTLKEVESFQLQRAKEEDLSRATKRRSEDIERIASNLESLPLDQYPAGTTPESVQAGIDKIAAETGTDLYPEGVIRIAKYFEPTHAAWVLHQYGNGISTSEKPPESAAPAPPVATPMPIIKLRDTKLIGVVRDGWESGSEGGGRNPYTLSSDYADAWEIGRYAAANGLPGDISKKRNVWSIGDRQFKVDFDTITQVGGPAVDAPPKVTPEDSPPPASGTTGRPADDERLDLYEKLNREGKLPESYRPGFERLKKMRDTSPDKWEPGDTVAYKVFSGGKYTQTNKGMRIESINPETKMATIRSIRDTGVTTTGGSETGWTMEVHIADLQRDNTGKPKGLPNNGKPGAPRPHGSTSHLTANEKRGMKMGLEQNMMEWMVGRTRYRATGRTDNGVIVEASKTGNADWVGRRREEKSTAVVPFASLPDVYSSLPLQKSVVYTIAGVRYRLGDGVLQRVHG